MSMSYYERENRNTGWFVGIIVALALLAIGYLVFSANNPTDDTDPVGGRSGMGLYTDAKTGCQYLGRVYGLTPRLDASGKHICIVPAS